jgi:basic amino acid/polyamine antiporter, APA family
MSMLDKTEPKANLSVLDGVAMMVGIIVGIGIFKTPALVAANVTSDAVVLGLWMLGGAVTLVGALVYAEFGSAYPSAGGEYHYLARGLGRPVAILFAWARMTVIQTGPRQGLDPKLHTGGPMMRGAALRELPIDGSAPGVH